ncbi:PBS lyase [Phormidesmis priestleyi ULC007]|uniref:PBS lyase n=1 Tax=Phormidesmis priestleyi ULC007 TaxID=1920490 RepID=A0A2T1DNN5_9CYAN|nr:HEAT repeat domain-containing protein [Phormidesmis priestleyi]PSB22113.1 PBS lyase [Phormidesmis priestleyi ULC007]PZO54919.1 MAG: PBS lyase [Phormidesmis priestleyi]
MATRNRSSFFLALQLSLLCFSGVATPQKARGQSTAGLAAQIHKLANSPSSDSAIATLKKQGAPAIKTLIYVVKDRKEPPKVRLFAISAIGEMGTDAKAAVPDLRNALKDSDEQVRQAAAKALGSIGVNAKAAVPDLINALNDPSKLVRVQTINALPNLGSDAKTAIPELIPALSDPSQLVRLTAIEALARFGQDAKPVVQPLAQLLSDPDRQIRVATASTLSRIGADASAAVPELTKALANSDRTTRFLAAMALGQIGTNAKSAVPELTKALSDPEKDVRSKAASSLGRIEAQSALSELVKTLKDENFDVRLSSASAIDHISGSLQDTASSLTTSELVSAYAALESAQPILEQSKNVDVLASVRRSLSVLKTQKDSRLFERFFEWSRSNPAIAGVLLYLGAMPSLWGLLLLIRPLWLLKLNHLLKPYTDFEVPSPLGGSIKVPLRSVLFLAMFHYHPRVLDAWVAEQIEVAREAFIRKNTVSDCKVYIPIPVVLDGNTIAELASQDLHSTFWDGRQCLLIWGEGGIGKTSLACNLAKWAMADDRASRLCRHQMLPVLIEQELDFKLPADKQPFREAIRGQLQALIDAAEPISDEFLEKLLRQRRILVIVDRLSELSEATREQIRPGHPDFPANALIVTSRVEETLDEVPKTTVKPLRIEGNRLSSFLEAYLTQRSKRELFTDSEYFDACSQLSKLVGQRNITVLLAKLYAEQMIAKEEGISEDNLPDNIPDLMLSYLNELNRDAAEDEPDNSTIHKDAQIIAWECLRQSYHPAPAKREAILAEMAARSGAESEVVKARLKHLEKRLRIVQAIGPAQDQICFALDPLAECLAALYLVELYRDQKKLWEEWLIQADAMPGAPESIQGFLLAMRDCCLTRSAEINVPDMVLEELGKRVGLSAETLRRTQVEQRIRRLAPSLANGDLQVRLDAICELGELGSAAKAVLPALIREFQARDWQIRREVARAIGQIGPEARTAIPALVERLGDDDRRVSGEAIASLGKLGVGAVPALIAALEAKPAHVRSTAAWVLSSFNHFARSAVPALTHALKDEDWQVRWVAAYALGCIGPDAKSAIPALIEAFKGEYELVSKEASRTLWRISGEAETIVAALGEMSNGREDN